jgi:murein DD-endopeptidase MepM/ murein hydrolase activator NlpD
MKKLKDTLRSGKHVNFLIYPDQGEGVRFRVSGVLAFVLFGISGLLLGVVFLFITSLAEMPYKAFLAESLLRENQRLRSYNAKVIEMERELSQYRQLTSRIARLAGIETVSLDRSPHWKMGWVLAEDALAAAENEAPVLPSQEVQQSPDGGDRIPKGLPLDGWISKEFSQDPGSVGGAHPGIDIAAPEGKEVRATASGVVKLAGWDDYYGNLIVIDHQNGYETYYGHNSKLALSINDIVKRGEVIALCGNTGRSTAPHLHYEIKKNGVAINPRDYLDGKNEER